jgi:hypothetical protein
MHRDAGHSVGLHLFHELSTLGQQVAHTLLLCQGLRQNKTHVFQRARRDPASPSGGYDTGITVPGQLFNERPMT